MTKAYTHAHYITITYSTYTHVTTDTQVTTMIYIIPGCVPEYRQMLRKVGNLNYATV
jgi:hypothetical protein